MHWIEVLGGAVIGLLSLGNYISRRATKEPSSFKEPGGVDLSSPEAAIRSFEDACHLRDIEAVLRCLDFEPEARSRLANEGPEPLDEALIREKVHALEADMRKELQEGGFPLAECRTSTISSVKELEKGCVLVTLARKSSDGTSSTQEFLILESVAGWRIRLEVA